MRYIFKSPVKLFVLTCGSLIIVTGFDGDSHANRVFSKGKGYATTCTVQLDATNGLILQSAAPRLLGTGAGADFLGAV